MVKDRIIRIDYNEVLNVIQDKASLDALCMAIYLKARFTNSIVYKHSAREMKNLCSLGYERIKRCLSKGRELGYFCETNRGLEIRKFHLGRYRYFMFSCNTDFKSIQKELRKVLILNKASQLHWLRNQVVNGTSQTASVKQVKRFKRLKGKMNLDDAKLETVGTLRKKRIAQYIACSKSKTTTLIRELKKENKIVVEPGFIDIDENTTNLNLSLVNKYREGWFICKHYNRLSLQIGNFYAPTYEVL